MGSFSASEPCQRLDLFVRLRLGRSPDGGTSPTTAVNVNGRQFSIPFVYPSPVGTMKFWILLFVLVGCFICLVPEGSQASIRSLEEAPGQYLVQSRHSLRDGAGHPWQVVLFRRDRQISLRLVGFPDQVRVQHAAPLKITVDPRRSAPLQLVAASDFFGQSAASLLTKTNIGQYDLQPIAGALRGDRPLTLTIPLEHQPETLSIPAAVVIEWQELLAPPLP